MASLWKILGGIGAIAAAPVTGGLSVGPGIGLLASGVTDKGKGGDDADPSKPPSMDQILSKQSGTSDKFLTEGDDLAKKGEASVDKGLDYFMKILSGDKASVTEAVAPEYEQILSQYDSARKNVSETGPRGGAKGEKIAESFFSQADMMTKVLAEARRIAASEVTRIGESRAGRGTAKEITGLNSLDSILASLTAKRNQNLQTFGDIGQGVGSIVASILLGSKN